MSGRKRSNKNNADGNKRSRVNPSRAPTDTPSRTRSSSRATAHENAPAQHNESTSTSSSWTPPPHGISNITSPRRDVMNVKTSEFGKVIKQRGFIDKSLLLDVLLPDNQEQEAEIFIITAPRRFGKSTLLSMVKTCLDIQSTSSRDTDEFKRLKIMDAKCAAKREQYFGECPIIFLDLLCTESFDNSASALQFTKRRVSEAYQQHEYLYENNGSVALKAYEKERCRKWCDKTIENETAGEGLKNLSMYLEKYHGRRPYLLIDEYDNMISKSLSDTTGNQFTIAIAFFSNLLTDILKSNPYLQGGLVTGILPVSGQSQSPFNNAERRTFLDGTEFNQFYGLTTQDLTDLKTNLENGNPSYPISDDQLDTIESTYNGYFSKKGLNVYGLWSVENYIKNGQLEAETFWVDSGYVTNFNAAFKSYPLKSVLERLLRGDHIQLDVIKVFSEEDLRILAKADPLVSDYQLFLSFLFHQGYLSYVDKISTHVKVPNVEIETMFASKMKQNYRMSLTDNFLSAARTNSKLIFEGLRNGANGSDKVFKNAVGDAKNRLQVLFEKFSVICSKMNEPCIHIFMGQVVTHAGTYELGPEIYVNMSKNSKSRLDQVVVERTKKNFAIIFEYQHDRGQLTHNAHGSLQKCIDRKYSNVFNDTELYPSERYNIEHYIQIGVSINDEKQVSLKCLRKDMDLNTQAVFVDYES